MGFFSGGPAIWELADPRSTLRQVGGTVEILVRTATLATFRDDGISLTTRIGPTSGWPTIHPVGAVNAKALIGCNRLVSRCASSVWRD
jgi:hypothetical protein